MCSITFQISALITNLHTEDRKPVIIKYFIWPYLTLLLQIICLHKLLSLLSLKLFMVQIVFNGQSLFFFLHFILPMYQKSVHSTRSYLSFMYLAWRYVHVCICIHIHIVKNGYQDCSIIDQQISTLFPRQNHLEIFQKNTYAQVPPPKILIYLLWGWQQYVQCPR